MIPITPLGGITILLDVDEIAAIETTPETVIELADQQRMVVADLPETIVHNIRQRRAARVAHGGHPRISTAAPTATSILPAAERTGGER